MSVDHRHPTILRYLRCSSSTSGQSNLERRTLGSNWLHSHMLKTRSTRFAYPVWISCSHAKTLINIQKKNVSRRSKRQRNSPPHFYLRFPTRTMLRAVVPNKRLGWKCLSLPTAPRLRRSRVRAWVQFVVRFVMKFLSQLAPCFWPWVEGLEYKILYETFGFSTFSTLRRYGRVGFEFARGMGEEEGCKKWENRFMKLTK